MADHPHTIDPLDDATGEDLIEQIAAVSDYEVAQATYRAAVKWCPKRENFMLSRASASGRHPLPLRGRWLRPDS
jgi:hypothetical protein